MRPTYLTINTSLVRENLRKIKDSLPEWSTSTAVIKANGYGHGSVMMGRIAVEEGYESLAVAIPEESVPLRNAGIMVPIYLLGLTRPQSFELVADTNSIPAVCESTDLEALDKVAENHDMIIRVAVAVDTGMHRIGIKPEDAVEFIKRVESYENLEVDGFFSHMSNADAADQTHAHSQALKFHRMVDEIKAFRPDADYRFSLANSAGLLSVKDSLFTDARPGIIQYGIMPSLDVPNRLGLKPVLSFHSEVVHVQQVPAGEGIGGPHIGANYPWPMSIMLKAFTAQNDDEIRQCIKMLMETDGNTGVMHEAFNKNNAQKYTRAWFAWPNTLFGELILKLINDEFSTFVGKVLMNDKAKGVYFISIEKDVHFDQLRWAIL